MDSTTSTGQQQQRRPRTAPLQEIAAQFAWMGWISLPSVYIALFQSVSRILMLGRASGNLRYVKRHVSAEIFSAARHRL